MNHGEEIVQLSGGARVHAHFHSSGRRVLTLHGSASLSWTEFEPDREAVLETAQGRLKGWGVALESVTYPSFVKCPVVRLIK